MLADRVGLVLWPDYGLVMGGLGIRLRDYFMVRVVTCLVEIIDQMLVYEC